MVRKQWASGDNLGVPALGLGAFCQGGRFQGWLSSEIAAEDEELVPRDSGPPGDSEVG